HSCVSTLSISLTCHCHPCTLHSFPTRRSSDLVVAIPAQRGVPAEHAVDVPLGSSERPLGKERRVRGLDRVCQAPGEHQIGVPRRSEEHTSELQSLRQLVCRLLLEKKKKTTMRY